jgi:hypothetical protein
VRQDWEDALEWYKPQAQYNRGGGVGVANALPASSRAKPREEVGAVTVAVAGADARRSRWSGSYALSMNSLCWTNISTGAGR